MGIVRSIVIMVWTLLQSVLAETGPKLIHLSLGDTVHSMVVVWSTYNDVHCHVEYGTDFNFTNTAGETLARLLKDNEKALTYYHRAELKNLQENQTYKYQIVCSKDQSEDKSDIYSFCTLSTDKTQVVNLLVYGDMGAVEGELTIPAIDEEISTGKYQAIFHNGDFAYDLHDEGGAIGDRFLRMIEPVAARIPYMTSPGNHELFNDLTHYRYRFSMPGTPWPMPVDKLWYSFDIGPVHIISYSSEVYFYKNQKYACDQHKWLLDDLTKVNENRHNTPWVIALGHRPMYCSNNDFDDCARYYYGQWVKRGLEDLFYGLGVDFIMEAHEHSYERLWPVHHGKVLQRNYTDPPAPVHIISGAAGNYEGVDKFGKPGPWSAYRAGEKSNNSYGRLSIVNRTHLHFGQVNAVTKKIVDDFWLIRYSHGPFIANIDCIHKPTEYEFCSCAPPIHYRSFAIFYWISTGLVIIICILLICYTTNAWRFCFVRLPGYKIKGYSIIDGRKYKPLDRLETEEESTFNTQG